MTEAHRRNATNNHPSRPATRGRVLHSSTGYDLMAWLMTFGRESAFRERILDLAQLAPGDAVLDVGCGTGSLAVRAKRRVGLTGSVCGIDASAEMIAAARRKAEEAETSVAFEQAIVEAMPFPDAAFDIVLSTLMFHHLPHDERRACAREARRVLKPGGRLVLVDFGATRGAKKGLFDRLHRHGRVAPSEVATALGEGGLRLIESGDLGFRDLHFAVATPR